MPIIIELLYYAVGELILYGIGRTAIALVSFGHARAERLKELVSINAPAQPGPGTQFVVPVLVTQLVGAAVLTAFMIALFALRN